MSINMIDIVLFSALSISLAINVVLTWFTQKLTKQFAATINQVDDLSVEVAAFAKATEELCESEVYMLGDEPIVKSVRDNAKTVLSRVDNLLREIPTAWQVSEAEQTENLNDKEQ
jgi:hypothetical protein